MEAWGFVFSKGYLGCSDFGMFVKVVEGLGYRDGNAGNGKGGGNSTCQR